MTIVQEVEKIINELPADKALLLNHWLNEFKAVRWYKQKKAYFQALKTLANFEKAKGDALHN